MYRYLLIAALTFSLLILLIGHYLTRPAKTVIGSPPPELHAASISIPSSSGRVSGWYIDGEVGKGAVLLLHGIRSDRRTMIKRAKGLGNLGISSLLIDLPANGESDGARITFGRKESEGVRVALEWMREHDKKEKLGVIGVSLGGASLLFSNPSLPLHAVVLESVYPTIREATEDRLSMRLGHGLGKLLAPILLLQLPLFIGIDQSQLAPIDELKHLRTPAPIASGSYDLHTTQEKTRRFFAVANEPKELWIVEGAPHVDLYEFDEREYEKKVFGFLKRHLSETE